MKNLKLIMLVLAILLLSVQPVMAATSTNSVLVATGETGGGDAPVDVDVTVESPTESAPAGEAGLFGLNSTILIVIAVLVVALVIGMIARKN